MKEDYRISVKIKNSLTESVVCTDIIGPIPKLQLNQVILSGSEFEFESTDNDRVYVTFKGMETSFIYPMAMTCPRMSSNAATGYGVSGLASYERNGTPVTFEFDLGLKDRADWRNSREYRGETVPYGS